MRNPQSKILSLEQALEWRQTLRNQGYDLVVTNGCFDVVHRGHAEFLWQARRQGDALLVLLNSDASVRSLKGPSRPVNCEADRAYVLAAFAAIDVVCMFDTERCDAELLALCPDVYCKSSEWRGKLDVAELAALAACHTRIVFLDLIPGRSTTGVLAKEQAARAVAAGSELCA